ncbi:MAG: polymer-forming cytoskeletal protein [Candidatus Omnitrophica bacterium]|nr:polymer-forming cytoskeletal protein [Candidatus Omnitrophota bacterium]
MLNRKDKKQTAERVLDVDASMQGSLVFKDPVNLKINGRFDGTLSTKGNLMIGEHAVVNADIMGDSIVVAGRINGNIKATKELKLISPACVIGDIKTPLLSVAEGAVLEGNSSMISRSKQETAPITSMMTAEELAKYLEVEMSMVFEWANNGKIPGVRDGNNWRFERTKIDEWVATEKIK